MEEQQVLSIDSQIKEMIQIAERDGLLNILDTLDISELGIREKFKDEISRYNKFRKIALGKSREKSDPEEFDAKSYAVYLLTEGSIAEKRELLPNLKSRLILKDRVITIEGA